MRNLIAHLRAIEASCDDAMTLVSNGGYAGLPSGLMFSLMSQITSTAAVVGCIRAAIEKSLADVEKN